MNQEQKLSLNGTKASHVLRLRKKISPYHIACTPEFGGISLDILHNPYDLRPAINITLKAIDDRLAALPAGKPLVILAGEIHSMPSHRLYQMFLAEALLKRREKIAMAFEYPHNIWASLAKNNMGENIPSWLNYACSDHDKDGTAVLSAFAGFSGCQTATLAEDLLVASCFQRIASVFNDAADKRLPFGTSLLDLADPSTAKAAKDYGEEKEIINASSIDGINIRNIVMARRGVAYAKRTGARILIQKIGMKHVFGDHNHPYKKSLCATYKEAGAAVLPVFISYNSIIAGKTAFDDLPEEAYPELQQSVIVEGLAEDQFFSESYAQQYNLPFQSGAEESFIERLHGNSGAGSKFHTVDKHYLGQLALYYASVVKETARNPKKVIDHPSPLDATGKIFKPLY